ncbi:hypothetical protein D3C73_1489290 [compost metagenome]
MLVAARNAGKENWLVAICKGEFFICPCAVSRDCDEREKILMESIAEKIIPNSFAIKIKVHSK